MTEDTILPAPKAQVINSQLDQLRVLSERARAVRDEADLVISGIRSGFVDATVVFVDMVDSSSYKLETSKTPELWIERVRTFCTMVSDFIEGCGGRVVKFIGDEVMGMFEGDAIDRAAEVAVRLTELEKLLTTAVGAPTRIKVTLDRGSVYLLKYDGHDQADPQGTPVDRCARIAKHTPPGRALCSKQFVASLATPSQWHLVGEYDFKGVGPTDVYHFGALPSSWTIETPEQDRKTMSDFILEMGKPIWEGELTPAWNSITMKDYPAEVSMAIQLDTFFDSYHRVVERYLTGATGAALKKECQSTIERSWTIAKDFWASAAQVMQRVTKVRPKQRKDYDNAVAAFKKGRQASIPKDAIQHYRDSIGLLKKCG